MSKFARRLLQVVAGIIGVLILLVIGISLIPDSTWKHLIEREISSKTNRAVAIDGPVHVHIFSLTPSVSVDGFRLQNAVWAPARPMVQIRHFEATVRLFSLLKLSPVFPLVRIDSPDLDLERDATQRANWDFSSPGASKPPPATASAPMRLPAILQLVLTDGKLSASDAVRKLKFKGEVSIAEHAKSADDHALEVRGSGTLNAKPFDLRVTGEPLLAADAGKPYDFDAAMTAADIKLDAHTKIQRAFDFGSVDSTFHLQGKDLADAYYLTGLALPNTPAYDVSGTIHRHDLKFEVDDFKGHLGKSDIAGTIGIDASHPRPILQANLKSSLLSLSDLAAPLGTQASAENKAGTLAPAKEGQVNPRSKSTARARPTVSSADAQAKETGFLLPDADLQVNRVREMDADVHFDAESIRSDKMPMKNVRFHLLLDDGRLRLSPLEFTLPQGKFSGEVSIDAQQPVPVTDIDMKLSNLDLSQFKSKGSDTAPLAGEMAGRIRLHGRGSSPHKAAADASGDLTFVVPHGEMRAAFAELTGINAKGFGLLLTKKDQSTEIRCGVASFHADDGDLKANSLLLDTTNVLVTGKGHINLKDEALNVELQGKPKEIRLVRIRAPIEVHGTLAHPDVGLKPGPLAAQTGAAVALGALLTPVAALLAFVDQGLAKDANCAAVLSQANGSH